MARRPDDLEFSADERLLRRIGPDDLKRGELKPSSLRLQISVSRAKHLGGGEPPLRQSHRNGIAAITAGAAVAASRAELRVVCIDEQTADDPAHALIALSVDVGVHAPDLGARVLEIRKLLASSFEVERAPP